MAKHCWHKGNYGTTLGNGMAGTWSVRCCYCGKHGTMEWATKHDQVKGHGPYYASKRAVETYPYPDEECPNRE